MGLRETGRQNPHGRSSFGAKIRTRFRNPDTRHMIDASNIAAASLQFVRQHSVKCQLD
jgi:hypothetical protein